MRIVLASTSPYRRTLLDRLGLQFECIPPGVDEQSLFQETPEALVVRLALAKAHAVARAEPAALVIGSDQTAFADGRILGKPHTHAAAVQQLQFCSGRSVNFLTSIAVVCMSRDIELVGTEPFRVDFRELTEEEIGRYLEKDRPYDCAGSFKIERLGIALTRGLHGRDPTSLEGLPLILLCELLRNCGLNPI